MANQNAVKAILLLFSSLLKFTKIFTTTNILRKVVIHMSPLTLIIAIIGGAAGLLSTLFLVISLPATILWKLYRKVRFGIPVTK